MEKSHQPGAGKSVALLLCVAACLFFNWPLLSIFGEKGGPQAIISLFFLWLCIIVCLLWYCRYEAAGLSADPADTEQP